MEALFTAASISGLESNVTTALTGFVAIAVLFTGYRYVKKVLGRG